MAHSSVAKIMISIPIKNMMIKKDSIDYMIITFHMLVKDVLSHNTVFCFAFYYYCMWSS